MKVKQIKYFYNEPYGRTKFYDEYQFNKSLASINNLSNDIAEKYKNHIIVSCEGIHTYFEKSKKFVVFHQHPTLSSRITSLIREITVSIG